MFLPGDGNAMTSDIGVFRGVFYRRLVTIPFGVTSYPDQGAIFNRPFGIKLFQPAQGQRS